MPIAGDRPETGVRIVVERDASRSDPPWFYNGAAHLPDASFPIAVTVHAEPAGKVSVVVSPSADREPPADLGAKIMLIVRTAYKQATADGEPPPWRIQRWRGEK